MTRIWFLLGHSISLTRSEGSQLPCCELPCGETHLPSNSHNGAVAISPMAYEDLNPANNYTTELARAPPSLDPSDETEAQAGSWPANA